MKRELDLIRTILLQVEAHDDPERAIEISAPEYSDDQVAYHIRLLHEAGLLHAHDYSSFVKEQWEPTSLTWAGHEFLDATRNDTVWRQLTAKLKDRGLDAPLSVVQQLAGKIIASMLGL